MSSSRNHGQNAHSSRVWLVAHCNGEAPLEENRQQVLLELAAGDGDRPGLDLVAVLDVSGSMRGTKLEETKIAMQFVIKKLSPMDRLSIVTFSVKAEILCPLCKMTEDSKAKLKSIVDGLKEQSYTNIGAGLEMGLKVLAAGGRDDDDDRVASIILMSDGDNNRGVHPTTVDVRSVAVYTFGFGDNHDATVLDEIARKSRGGTYNNVTKLDDLTIPFSTILGGLLSVAVQDLKLIVREHPGHSKIEKVDGGPLYPQKEDAGAGEFTISFGYLYAREVRKVIVDLFLPAAVDDLQQAAQDDAIGPGGDDKPCCSFRTVCCCWSRPRAGSGAAPAAAAPADAVRRGYVATVITAQCSYRIKGGKQFSSPAVGCSIRRTGSADPMPPPPPTEVKMELIRRHHTNVLGEAIVWADREDLNSAQNKLQVELKTLDVEGQSSSNSDPMIGICRTEVETSIELTTSLDTYYLKGRAFMRSCRTSHERQRVATRGADVVDQAGPFTTRLMESYVLQAQQFKENPDMPPPSVEQDLSTERRSPQPAPAVAAEGRIWWGRELRDDYMRRSSWWAWAILILCTVLAIGVIVAGVAVFAVYLLYKPKMPYLVVSDAQLGQLMYGGQDGTIHYLQVSITILAKNNNSKADASFSRGVDLALGFHGAEVALLRAEPFAVARESSLPLQYNVVSAGRPLDADGMRSMDESLQAGLVQLDLSGKARTRWKVGIFVNLQFWTRISCHLRFFFPGNGTVIPTDLDRCRSRSP